MMDAVATIPPFETFYREHAAEVLGLLRRRLGRDRADDAFQETFLRALREIVPTIAKSDRDLADQIQRAATSVSLNLAEGQCSMKGNRQKHYSLAHGSANEVKSALFVARAWGWIDETDEALAVLDRLLALLWKLTH